MIFCMALGMDNSRSGPFGMMLAAILFADGR